MPSLDALGAARFDDSKRWSGYRLVAHFTTIALSILTLLTSDWWTYILMILAGVSTVFALVAQLLYADRYQFLAERIFRRAMICDALGVTVDPGSTEVLRYEKELGQRTVKSAADIDKTRGLSTPAYYLSTAPPGMDRLFDHLEEDTFWTKELYWRAALFALIPSLLFVVITIVVLLVLLGALPSYPSISRWTIPKVVVLLLSLVTSSEELWRFYQWWSTSSSCEELFQRLQTRDNWKQQNRGLEELLTIYGDFFTATASTPPIPTWFYRCHHDRIQREYEAHFKERTQGRPTHP